MPTVTFRNDSQEPRAIYELTGQLALIEPTKQRTLTVADGVVKQVRLGMAAGDKFRILKQTDVSELSYPDGKKPPGAQPIATELDPEPPAELTPPPQEAAPRTRAERKTERKKRDRPGKPIKKGAPERIRARRKADD